MAPVVVFLVLTGSVALGVWKRGALSRWPGCPNRLEDGVASIADICFSLCVVFLLVVSTSCQGYFPLFDFLTLWSALRARGEFAGLVVRIVYGMLEGVRIVMGAITR